MHALISVKTLDFIAKPDLGCMGMPVSLSGVGVASALRVVGVIVILRQDSRGRMCSTGCSDNAYIDLVDRGGFQE